MSNQAHQVGKKGGAKRVADEINKIRKTPISKDVFTILDENKKREREQPLKKSARPRRNIEI